MKSALFLTILLAACHTKPDASAAEPAASKEVFTPPVCTDADVCEKRCASGDREGCFERGNSLVGHDDSAAAQAFERACDLGLPLGCAHAGRMFEFAHGVAKDDAKAFVYYADACDGGAEVGCYNEAILLEAGRGTSRDLDQARALYGRVCSAGSPTACDAAHRVAVKP
jgi:TPR repeat protein